MHDADLILCAYGVSYWAESGTLLGAVRNRGIIPWDDDLDICIKNTDEKLFLALAPAFEKCGYTVAKDPLGYKIFHSGSKNNFPCLDVIVYKKEGERYVPVPPDLQKWFPKDHITESEIRHLKRYIFGSFEITGPADPGRLLVSLFGSDWSQVAYRDNDHEKGKKFGGTDVKVKLTPEMRKPAEPTAVNKSSCLQKLAKNNNF